MNYGFLKDKNGNKIYINDNSIYHDGEKLNEVINAKQDKLISGTGIEITGKNIINNIQENYSTNEQKIGKWIDGKPLYRKVLNITNPAGSNTDYKDVADLNISTLVNLYGYYKNASGKFDIPFYDSDSNYCVMFISQYNQLRGRFGLPSEVLEAKVILEYTKKTD